jgi:chromosome segregation ATPase
MRAPLAGSFRPLLAGLISTHDRIGLFITFCWVAPTPIPLSEIASQGESANASLRDIETNLQTDRLTVAVEKRLPQLTNEIDLRTAEQAKLLASSLPLEFLGYMKAALQRFSDELSTENHDLTDRVKTLDDQIAQLDSQSKIWKSTLQLPELSQTAPEVPKHVQSLIDSIGRTQQAVKSLRARDLTLQGGVWRQRLDCKQPHQQSNGRKPTP